MIPPKEFLRKIKPFSFLSGRELDVALSGLEVALFKKGQTIYQRGHRHEYVYVVFSGLVGLFDDEGVVDYLSRGEVFGLLALNEYPSPLTAKALEDTVCYLILTEKFSEILTDNEQFSSFFQMFLSRRFRSFKAIASDRKIAEEAAFVTPVEKLVYKKPVACRPESSIEHAVREMEKNGVSSVVIVDEEMRPVGILTHKDLRRVIIQGDRTCRVRDFMSSPIQTITARTTVFDALKKMVDTGVDHLPITQGDELLGMVTRKDIQIHLEPSSSIIALFRRIVKATSVGELEVLFRSIRTAIAKMALGEPNFYDLTRMISSVHDAITTKVIDLVNKGEAQHHFTWLHMGSSGRKEEIIALDQDNALIRRGDPSMEWANDVTDALHTVGVYRCPGNYMASNPEWNQPLSVWKDYFYRWFHNPVPYHVRYLSIFLDIRPICGNEGFYSELLGSIRSNVTDQAVRLLAQDAIDIEPPLGIFGLYSIHKGVDLKMQGIYPIVNGARVLAVEQGLVDVINTKERLEALEGKAVISNALCHDLLESYGFLQGLRLRHQSRAVLSQMKEDNLIKAKELSKVDLLILKESFKVVAAFQKFLMKRYDIRRAGTIGF